MSTPLSRLPLFRDASEEDLAALAGATQPVTLAPGDVIARMGAPADTALLVVSGRLTASISRDDASRAVFDLGPGDLLGEAALFTDDARHPVTVTTVTAVQALRLFPDMARKLPGNRALMMLEQQALESLSKRIRAIDRVVQQAWMAERTEAAQEPPARAGRPRPAEAAQPSGLRGHLNRLLGGGR